MRFSSADSVSRPTPDIRTSIAPSSNIAIILLPLFCTGRTRQDHLGAAKESFHLFPLGALERPHVFHRQLPESLPQPVESNARGSIGDPELIRDLAQRNVTSHTDHQGLLFRRQLTRHSLGELRNRFTNTGVGAGRNAGARSDAVLGVTLGDDPLRRWRGFVICALSRIQSAVRIPMPVPGAIAQGCDEVAREVA